MTEVACHECGRTMERGFRPVALEHKGLTTEVDMPGWYCANCGESIHSGGDMAVSDRALNRMKAEVAGLLPPEEVRSIRKRLKLSQRDAGAIIGGGPNAFQKYESGEVLVSKAVSSALVLLDSNPEGLAVLKSRNESRRTAV